MNNPYVKYTLIFLEIILLFSLVVCLLRFNSSTSDEEPGSDVTDVPSDEPSSDDDTAQNPDSTPSEDEEPPVDDTPTEDITPTPEVVDFSTMSYVAFGDSITYGADYTLNYSQMADPYPELVSNALGLASYTNKAINASTFCSNSLGRVCMTDRILAYTEQADIISLMLGTNDYGRSLPLGTFGDTTHDTIYGSLYLIAEHLTSTQDDAFIFFMTPYKRKNHKVCNVAGYNLEDVANAIKEVAAVYNIPVLDMFNEGQYELEMYNYGSDGLHPSQEFMKEYTAPQIEAFIRQNYSNKR